MAWLLDTNVLSELRRPSPEPKVVAFIGAQSLDQLYISVVTLAEIRFGIELVSEPDRRVALNDWLTHAVRPMFHQRVLPVPEDVMLVAAPCGRRPEGRPHIFATGSNHCRNGHALRAQSCLARSKPIRAGAGAGDESVGAIALQRDQDDQ
jgi:predicted nucleic acid-binding protein